MISIGWLAWVRDLLLAVCSRIYVKHAEVDVGCGFVCTFKQLQTPWSHYWGPPLVSAFSTPGEDSRRAAEAVGCHLRIWYTDATSWQRCIAMDDIVPTVMKWYNELQVRGPSTVQVRTRYHEQITTTSLELEITGRCPSCS